MLLAPGLSQAFGQELLSARQRVAVLEEANRSVQDSLDRITRLSAFSEGLDHSAGLDDVSALLFEEVHAILPVDALLMDLVDREGREFHPAYTSPDPRAAEARAALEAQVASGVFGWVVGIRRPTTVPLTSQADSLLLVPLVTSRQTVGMLTILTPLDSNGVEHRHITLLSVIARQAADYIDNLWLRDDIRRQHEALQATSEAAAARRLRDLGLLVEIAGHFSGSPDRRAALQFLVDATCRHLSVGTVAIFLLQPDGDLAVAASIGLSEAVRMAGRLSDPDALPVRRILITRAPVVLAAGSAEEGFAPLWAAGIRAFLGVPLSLQGRPIGALCALSRETRQFSTEEAALLTGLAAQGALALENARLFAEVRGRIEKQQRTLRRIVNSARMASVGMLAGGVAHDINNPLCIISNHLQLLRLRPEQLSPEMRSALTGIEGSVARIAASIQTLLDYAKGQAAAAGGTDVNETVERLLLLIQYHPLCRYMRVETELAAGLPRVDLNRATLEQVLLEILTNAREAMPETGRVRIRSACQPARGGRGMGTVELTVEDDGPGIPPEELPRIYDPFFTTKESDRAMGMGFWICREVVAGQGGEILVESDGRTGTRVTLRLPVGRQAEAGSDAG